jgi:hypothetical protein
MAAIGALGWLWAKASGRERETKDQSPASGSGVATADEA